MKIKVSLLVLVLALTSFFLVRSFIRPTCEKLPARNIESSELLEVELTDKNQDADDKTPVDAVSSASPNEENSDPPEPSSGMPVRSFFKAIADTDLDQLLALFNDDLSLITPTVEADTIDDLAQYANDIFMGSEMNLYRSIESESTYSVLVNNGVDTSLMVYEFSLEDNHISKLTVRPADTSDLDDFRDETLESSNLLPDAYISYLLAVDTDDLDMFCAAFTPNGTVLDVTRLFEGRDAIRAWADKEVMFLNYRVGRITYSSASIEIVNHIRLSENSSGFYGSYNISLRDGLINYADLQYSDRDAFEY